MIILPAPIRTMDPQLIYREIEQMLPDAPAVRPNGSLLIMVGLPGSGKSSVVRCLQELVPSVAVSTDWVRRTVRRHPTYTAAEMMFVYEVCQQVILMRLQRGQRVIFDGSNYQAIRRERLLWTAGQLNAPVALCLVQAAETVVRQRLERRASGQRDEGDFSDADWSVYQWMVQAQEPIIRPHLALDTSARSPAELAVQLRDYWLAREARHPMLTGGL